MSVPTPPSGTGSESDPSHARKLAEDVPRSAAPAKPSSAQFDAFAGAHVRHRRRRRKKEPPYLAIAAGVSILILAAVMVGTGLVYLLNHRTTQAARGGDLLGRYIDDASTVDREYQHYYGKAPETPIPSQEFQRAAEMVRKRGFAQAADVLESVAKQAALPVVYNDLGVLYAQLNDWARAGTDFREALALDQHYAAVLDNIHRMKGLSPDVGGAFTREVEPNNNRFAANLIAVGIPVEGEITAGAGDIDFFRFSFPPSPRDVLAVELSNHDFKFSPRLDIYDGEMRVLDWGRKTAQPGNSLTVYGSTAPNTTVYVAVSAAEGTAGKYLLSLKPMKGYDAYEPNDDIFHAHQIEPVRPPEGRLEYGQLQANIMDRDDTDFYSFLASRTGKVTIEIHNESVTLIPAVQFYGTDMRSLGFGPNLRNPGESLQATLDVEKGQTYYVQVWSQANTSGAYTLAVH